MLLVMLIIAESSYEVMASASVRLLLANAISQRILLSGTLLVGQF